MKTASQRTKNSSLLTKGTFFSQYIDKTNHLGSSSQNKLSSLLQLTTGRKLNSVSRSFFSNTGNNQQVYNYLFIYLLSYLLCFKYLNTYFSFYYSLLICQYGIVMIHIIN